MPAAVRQLLQAFGVLWKVIEKNQKGSDSLGGRSTRQGHP